MKLFDVILRLIKQLALVESTEYQQLLTDTRAWEDEATEDAMDGDKPDRIKRLYHKIHKGVLIKLAMPFLYFILLKWAINLGREDDHEL